MFMSVQNAARQRRTAGANGLLGCSSAPERTKGLAPVSGLDAGALRIAAPGATCANTGRWGRLARQLDGLGRLHDGQNDP